MNGKSLSLRQASAIVVTVCCAVLFEAGLGIYELHAGHKGLALSVGISAFVVLMTLPIHVANWLKIKKSGTVNLGFVPPAQLPRIPFFLSAAFTILLTIAIAVVSYQSFFADLIAHPSRPLRWEMAGFNLLLWMFVSFVWYCLIVTREQKLGEPVLEQTEGVWPPAPRVAIEEDNKD